MKARRVGFVLVLVVALAAGVSCTKTEELSSMTGRSNLEQAARHYDRAQLHEALDQIKTHLQQTSPEVAASLRPGLPRSEVERLTEGLRCKLPEEVIDLYAWADGTPYGGDMEGAFVWYHAFLSLEHALAERGSSLFSSGSGDQLPLFVFPEEQYFIVCDQQPRQAVPVWHRMAESPEPTLAFTNLTTMMQTNAAWMAQGLEKEIPSAGQPLEALRRALKAQHTERVKVHAAKNPGARFPYGDP